MHGHSILSTTSASRPSIRSELSAVTLSHTTISDASLCTEDIQRQLEELQAGFHEPLSSTPMDRAIDAHYGSIEQVSVEHEQHESSMFDQSAEEFRSEVYSLYSQSLERVLPHAAATARPQSHTFSASVLSQRLAAANDSAHSAATTILATSTDASGARRRCSRCPLLVLGLIVTALAMYAYTWLCIGSLWDPDGHLATLPVAIVNNDAGFDSASTLPINTALIRATQNRTLGQVVIDRMTSNADVHFRWILVSQKEERNHNAVLGSVRDGYYGAAFYIPPDFSRSLVRRLQPAAQATPAANGPTIEYVHNQGRDFTADALTTLATQKLILGVTDDLQWLIHTNAEVAQTLLASGSTLWIHPLHLQNTTLHPVNRIGQNFACFIQIVIMYVACIMIVTLVHRMNNSAPKQVGVEAASLDLHHCSAPRTAGSRWQHSAWFRDSSPFEAHRSPMMARRVLVGCLIALAALAIIGTLVWSVPACLPGYQSAGGHPVFSWLWILYTGLVFLCALNLLCMLVGVELFPVPAFLFLVVLLTTSSAIIDDSLVPSFFQVGRGFPLFYAVRGLRFFYFGALENVMWINGLVLLAWMLLPLAISALVACRRNLMRHSHPTSGGARK